MNHPEGKIFIKPTSKDVLVRNPKRGGHLNIEGEYVPRNAYWLRRKNDGDIIEAKPPKKTASRSTHDQD